VTAATAVSAGIFHFYTRIYTQEETTTSTRHDNRREKEERDEDEEEEERKEDDERPKEKKKKGNSSSSVTTIVIILTITQEIEYEQIQLRRFVTADEQTRNLLDDYSEHSRPSTHRN
jgi:hypothetical protein